MNYDKILEIVSDGENGKGRLGQFLCDSLEEWAGDCDKCPVVNLCSVGHNGFIAWLDRNTKKG